MLEAYGAPELHRQPVLEVWKTREGLEQIRAGLAEQPCRPRPLLHQPRPQPPNYDLPLDEVADEQQAEDAEPYKDAAYPGPVHGDRGGEGRGISQNAETAGEDKDHGDRQNPELLVPAVDFRSFNMVKDVHKRFLSAETAGPTFAPSLSPIIGCFGKNT